MKGRTMLLLEPIHHVIRDLRIDALRAHGTAPDKVIHTAEALGAKPTRYQPSPGRAQPGKRRRQWR